MDFFDKFAIVLICCLFVYLCWKRRTTTVVDLNKYRIFNTNINASEQNKNFRFHEIIHRSLVRCPWENHIIVDVVTEIENNDTLKLKATNIVLTMSGRVFLQSTEFGCEKLRHALLDYKVTGPITYELIRNNQVIYSITKKDVFVFAVNKPVVGQLRSNVLKLMTYGFRSKNIYTYSSATFIGGDFQFCLDPTSKCPVLDQQEVMFKFNTPYYQS